MLGELVGSYQIIRVLGEGGMGTVYEAVHQSLGRRAAIKVLRPEHSQNQELLQRFFNEARAVNIVQHPSLVNIYEFGTTPAGTAYIVMEFLAGESLRARLGRVGGRMGLAAVPIARQVANALAATHQKQIVHRDLKPERPATESRALNPRGGMPGESWGQWGNYLLPPSMITSQSPVLDCSLEHCPPVCP